ncbi:ecdysteroid-regulated 16 kDa protein-like [Mizuhopecten yessoensis]|uniref:Epididymal secretory protein E1 n=1 Tax=Mizuhopecten yessoensis TaxID=6573 RepID=A0A210PIQ8_MIZYE|nr:ecdysteroid-regulated 16 kDa protein-like [Mizuhopecten yessoensis]OWF36381.1 Epididymal secretory protein E1 [Mizuhopecten yessoensis]
MKFTVVVLSALLVSALANPITFKDCGSTGATVHSVDVGGCTTEPCHLVHGKNATMIVNYTASEDVTHPTNDISGIIAGIPIKFPTNPDCCASKNLVCPVKSGTSSQYTIAIYVNPTYPKISVLVKLAVLDDNKKDFLCLVFPAIITDS